MLDRRGWKEVLCKETQPSFFGVEFCHLVVELVPLLSRLYIEELAANAVRPGGDLPSEETRGRVGRGRDVSPLPVPITIDKISVCRDGMASVRRGSFGEVGNALCPCWPSRERENGVASL